LGALKAGLRAALSGVHAFDLARFERRASFLFFPSAIASIERRSMFTLCSDQSKGGVTDQCKGAGTMFLVNCSWMTVAGDN
jgi:hypothetical protein